MMSKHQPLTEAEMIDIGRWIEMTQAPGRLTISGTPPRPGGLIRLLQGGFVERLYNEALRLQAECDRLGVLLVEVAQPR